MDFLLGDQNLAEFYSNQTSTNGNSGFDLYLPADYTFPAGHTVCVNFGVSAKTHSNSGYWLMPRSSMSKTPLRMANSMGLIDPSYRGKLMVMFWNSGATDITIPKGTRLVQVALPSLMPFNVIWVDRLDETERGLGGFGSTGGTFTQPNYLV